MLVADLKRRFGAMPLEVRFRILKNSFKGKDCVIIGCGPSLSDLDIEEVKDRLKDKVVISIKQAVNLFPGETHFHVYNYIHYEDYSHNKDNLISLELTRFAQKLSNADLHVPINVSTAGRYSHSVVATKSFDNFTFDKSIKRPFGPGIMFEVCFFLAVHLGCKSITTIGFDVANLKSHFYGPDEVVDEKKEKVLSVEQKQVLDGLIPFSKWLKMQGCDLRIISDLNPADRSVRRMSIKDL